MSTFGDLKEAIFKVTKNAVKHPSIKGDYVIIEKKDLDILKAEYNIHFVEPEEDPELAEYQDPFSE